MDIDKALHQLIQAAKAKPLDDRVPVAFEKRIMGAVLGLRPPDLWTLWTSALWRVATPCTALAIVLCAWMLYSDFIASPSSLTQDLDDAVLAAVNLPGEQW